MIHIKNTQRKYSINIDQLHKDACLLLNELRYSDFDLSILLTTNKRIRFYNKNYRHKDKPTDILSFPYHAVSAGKRIHATSSDAQQLGDLIISVEYVIKDAPRWGHTFEQRLRVLLVHGICHLLGYDHEKDEDYKVMRKKERALLKKLDPTIAI